MKTDVKIEPILGEMGEMIGEASTMRIKFYFHF